MRHKGLSVAGFKGLEILRARIAEADIPSSALDESINIATWNICGFGHGNRTDESIHYIAEIINQFDLVVVQELMNKLGDLDRVMDILGPYWKVMFSDYNDDTPGHTERIAFLYDKRALVPTGLIAEATPERVQDAHGNWVALDQWFRSPYMASFTSGSFDFIVLAVHIRPTNQPGQVEALQHLANWVKTRQDNKGRVMDKDWIVVGDFNIEEIGDECYNAITSHGLRVPARLQRECESNLKRTKIYDLILQACQVEELFSDRGGVIDFYRDGHEGGHKVYEPYKDISIQKFYRQMSDHLPVWIQLNVDYESVELDRALGRR